MRDQGDVSPAQQVATWNAKHPGCTPVIYKDTRRQTRAPAQVLSDGRAVLWLFDIEGAIDLDQVEPA